jgi:hypothetical protein
MSLSSKALQYIRALSRLMVGMHGKLLSQEKIEERFAICTQCPEFTGKMCSLCGCCAQGRRSYLNKLAFPTEKCPADPPKWNSEIV